MTVGHHSDLDHCRCYVWDPLACTETNDPGELERQILDQLREIQGDIKALNLEIRKEMLGNRNDNIRRKAEVEAVPRETLADLQQVRGLTTTTMDLGRMAEDRG